MHTPHKLIRTHRHTHTHQQLRTKAGTKLRVSTLRHTRILRNIWGGSNGNGNTRPKVDVRSETVAAGEDGKGA